MSNSYDEIQTRDRTDTATAAENLLKERIERRSHISTSSVQNYATDNDKLAVCTVKEPKGGYQLTPVGEKALETP